LLGARGGDRDVVQTGAGVIGEGRRENGTQFGRQLKTGEKTKIEWTKQIPS
jgi:hypothetical protein